MHLKYSLTPGALHARGLQIIAPRLRSAGAPAKERREEKSQDSSSVRNLPEAMSISTPRVIDGRTLDIAAKKWVAETSVNPTCGFFAYRSSY